MEIDYFRFMKNKFSLFLILIIPVIFFGQKSYLFDYALEYNFQLNENAKFEKRFLLTNSKENSYLLEVTEKDSLNYELKFIDQNGYYSMTELSRAIFFKAEAINLDCSSVMTFTNPYKYQVKNYDFHILNDTLIDNNDYSRYLLKSNNLKREKKKKLASLFFVLEKDTDFHQPVLMHSTAFEEWKLEKNISNGIPKLFYFKSYKTNKILSKYTLLDYKKINKYIIIPEDCTKSKIELKNNF